MYLRKTEPETVRPFKTDLISSSIFIFVCILLTVFPFIPPSKENTDDIPYYAYPLVGILLIVLCIPWWYYALIYRNANITLTRTISQDRLTECTNQNSNQIELPVIK